ncbi:zf-HC2 domain-containing protein [Kitasatospora sp. NBC_01287]|uniref:zf-HC2 domain-containing protein n=1 Tax=Kitasatospora sp. NBC_01287 TaxID=2903573 RepID=UPI00224F1B5A|nr:zf-HC2 domain-containing protein [Kitasatospora sp. NBC_01287]MCX4746911.1 zf-HC2 domain-containing protein [Kitasatospora sp. NBC_01287]
MSGAGRSGARRPAPAEQWSAHQEVPVLRPIAVRQSEPSQVEEHHLGDRLTAYLDGELGHDDRERVQSHLATCPQCLGEAEAARSVKQLLTTTEAPAPSGPLLARLLAVAAQPDELDGGRGPGGGQGSGGAQRSGGGQGLPPVPTLGGSRLTGGSFGRGAGSSFGRGALGADRPLPGGDPGTGFGSGYPHTGHGPEPRPWGGRRGPATHPEGTAERRRPTTAPLGDGARPRGRRLVVAAAGAFSVAAVALGGFGSLGLAAVAGDSPADDQHGTAVTPQVPGGAPVAPLSGPLTVDLPLGPRGAGSYDLLTPGLTARTVNPVIHGHAMLP